MKYAGMPFGMWVLFAGSFQKQLTAVLGYDTPDASRLDVAGGAKVIGAASEEADLRTV